MLDSYLVLLIGKHPLWLGKRVLPLFSYGFLFKQIQLDNKGQVNFVMFFNDN